MPSTRFSIGRFLAFAALAGALVFGYSVASTAIEFPAATPAADTTTPAAPAAPASAPATDEVDQALVLAGLQVWKDSGCRGCHGWAANGEREGPNPGGPSLRATNLDMDTIRLTIACGRPGTPMPYFWRDAYRGPSTDCYGMTGAQLGANTPNRGPSRLNDADLDALAYYIANYIKGLGEITFEQCELFWGVGNARCTSYPHG